MKSHCWSEKHVYLAVACQTQIFGFLKAMEAAIRVKDTRESKGLNPAVLKRIV